MTQIGPQEVKDWQRYYAATDGRPPRPTLLRALDAFEREGIGPGDALDLGCGAGRDTVEMLRRGWRVTAIDAAPDAEAALLARLEPARRARLRPITARLETTKLPPASLVNASFVLPLLAADAFADVWTRLGAALGGDGRFAGQLLGPNDGTVREGRSLGHDRAALDMLLAPFEIERLEEEETDSITPWGTARHWHIWHLNLRKPRLTPASHPG